MSLELNKIYHGDCLELLKDVPDNSVDCIICDLPYGTLNNTNPLAKWDKECRLMNFGNSG